LAPGVIHLNTASLGATLAFLRSPPGNRLEALVDDRKGQHSIRINDQWRICFRWTKAGPEGVAMRLARYFGGDAQSWLNLQTLYDLRVAERTSARKIEREIVPAEHVQAA
jgi:hypothetical protein